MFKNVTRKYFHKLLGRSTVEVRMLGNVRGSGEKVEVDRGKRKRNGEDELEGAEEERPPGRPLPPLPSPWQQHDQILIE